MNERRTKENDKCMDQKTIDSWSDLTAYGILPLSSEACGIGLRVLCDLTPRGRRIVENLLRMQTVDKSNWNSRDGQTASVMLPHGLLTELAVWCLLHDFPIVAVSQDRATGMDQEYYAELTREHPRAFEGSRVYRREGTASEGFDNRHELSQRVK
jgi:hypothetical protein